MRQTPRTLHQVAGLHIIIDRGTSGTQSMSQCTPGHSQEHMSSSQLPEQDSPFQPACTRAGRSTEEAQAAQMELNRNMHVAVAADEVVKDAGTTLRPVLIAPDVKADENGLARLKQVRHHAADVDGCYALRPLAALDSMDQA